MKTDTRVRYTKMVISQVFLRLLDEKPINKITIKEICDCAEINRGTFYRHYEDVYDLLNKIEEEIVVDFQRRLVEISEKDIQTGVEKMLYGLKENYVTYRALFQRDIGNNLALQLSKICYQYIVPRLDRIEGSQMNDSQQKMCYSYLTAGTSGVIEYWIYNGMQETPEEVAYMIKKLNMSVRSGLVQ